ncbi:hypothetical protein Pmar_PMAR019351 [Perkinsus marinus ATCC 50983]|uniref:Uncharacterized protein n=1 Tax=Perkinsus marinus (strain ATCC 50983 / TXsc) TaxID=423536 RepID=C5KZI1_PERM5|nr:hypothetical protein Pmar_PMAR019351 [Perkinsus marinus ATCC 50983]EER10112.1 hypothetical protein Pmar_PMAR019351 [Perkinsus marinus ATCC 50983]|eukprot:XP_002778317.1 hypothetical protein Pmar_PMAR019351 [Perkinsus marinus ATCC 50983]
MSEGRLLERRKHNNSIPSGILLEEIHISLVEVIVGSNFLDKYDGTKEDLFNA